MDFKERYCPVPCLKIDPTDDTSYIPVTRCINPLKMSAYEEGQLTWVNKKNQPVYENVTVLFVDGEQHIALMTEDELMVLFNMFFS